MKKIIVLNRVVMMMNEVVYVKYLVGAQSILAAIII